MAGNPGYFRSGKPTASVSWLAVGIAFIAGCASSFTPVVRPGLEESFDLRVGQSAIVGPEALEVGFETVSADSRCAKGEICVWEGDAIVRIRLQQHGGSQESLELHTAAMGPRSANFLGYGVSLIALDPVPVSGRTIAPQEYVVTLKVRKATP